MRWAAPFVLLLFLLAACDSAETGPRVITVDLLGQLTPEAAPYADIWGYADPATDKEYALLGTLGINREWPALYVIDVSAPGAPTVVGTVNEGSGFDIKTWQQYAYTVTGGPDGGQDLGRIIDLSDPASPAVVGGFPSAHNIFIDEQGLLYAEVPGLRIFDLRGDPTNPVLIWQEDTPSNGHDATAIGDRLYDFHGDATHIYDITDPADPLLLGSITLPTIQYHHSGWPTADGRYLYVCDELSLDANADITVWDLQNPAVPELVTSIVDTFATVHNLYIDDEIAFVSYYAAGLRVYDVEDPTQPILADEYDTDPDVNQQGFNGAWGVYPFTPSGNVYVSDRTHGLFVFEVTGR